MSSQAAAVILFRRGKAGVEVFWLKRGAQLSFAGGYYAFPGGQLDAGDARVPVEGAEGEAAGLVAAGARELFEETGVLVARGADRVDPSVLARKSSPIPIVISAPGRGEMERGEA